MRLNVYRIKVLMAELQLSQKALADKVGIHPNSLGVVMKNKKTSTITTGKIAKALGVSVEEITVKEQ